MRVQRQLYLHQQLIANMLVEGNVTVSWTGTNVAYNDISSYIVYRSTNGGAWTEAGTLTAGAGARSLALAAGRGGLILHFFPL